MDCFWRDGYEATSMLDLAFRMALSAPASTTRSATSSLFREVLQRYVEQSTRERIVRLESSLPPQQAVCAFLHEIVERSGDGDRRGCLLVNTRSKLRLMTRS